MSANVPANTLASVPESLSTSSSLPATITWVGMIARAVNYLLGVCKLIYSDSTKQLIYNGSPSTTVPLIHSDIGDDTEYFVKLRGPANKSTLALMGETGAAIILEYTGAAPAANTPLGQYVAGGFDGTTYLNGVGGMTLFSAEQWSNTASGSFMILGTQTPTSHRLTLGARPRIYIRTGIEICDGSGAEPTGGDKGAGTLNVATANGLYCAGGKGATYQGTASPTGTASLVAVMMGIAGSITPKTTGTIVFVVSGDIFNSGAGNGAAVAIKYGTGGAPANGGANAGTLAGNIPSYTLNAANAPIGFALNGLVTGLSVGTAYWIDLALLSLAGGTSTVRDVSITAFELTV